MKEVMERGPGRNSLCKGERQRGLVPLWNYKQVNKSGPKGYQCGDEFGLDADELMAFGS